MVSETEVAVPVGGEGAASGMEAEREVGAAVR
jgi:hypothetical protein